MLVHASHASHDTAAYMAAAVRAAAIDRQNEVLWGKMGSLRRRGGSPAQPGGKEESPAGTGPTAGMFGGREPRECTSSGFSFLREELPFTFISTWGEFSQINYFLKLPFFKATPPSVPWRCPIYLADPRSLVRTPPVQLTQPRPWGPTTSPGDPG